METSICLACYFVSCRRRGGAPPDEISLWNRHAFFLTFNFHFLDWFGHFERQDHDWNEKLRIKLKRRQNIVWNGWPSRIHWEIRLTRRPFDTNLKNAETRLEWTQRLSLYLHDWLELFSWFCYTLKWVLVSSENVTSSFQSRRVKKIIFQKVELIRCSNIKPWI